MTQLTPTTLFSVEVPLDAKDFKIVDLSKSRKAISYTIDEYGGYSSSFRDILNENFEILGEVTKDKITFDVEPYVKSIPSILGSGHRDYFDYCFVKDNITKTSYRFTDKNQSFYILLQSKDIYFENPFGKLESCCSGQDCGCMGMPINISSKEEWEEYQEAESKVIKGKLVILKPI